MHAPLGLHGGRGVQGARPWFAGDQPSKGPERRAGKMERETRFELATLSLEG
jgi:hypothetical protein